MVNKRKPYQKPEIERVNLTPQEAVLVGCKTSASPTGKAAGRNNCSTRDYFCDQAVS